MSTGILYFLTAAIICSTSAPQRAAQVELQTQIKRHYSYFSQGRYDLMWKMSSKRFQNSNDNNEEKYVSDLQKYGFGHVKAKILGMRIVGNSAEVSVHLSIWSSHDKKWLKEAIKEEWIFEDGCWVFDNQLLPNQGQRASSIQSRRSSPTKSGIVRRGWITSARDIFRALRDGL